MVTDTLKQTRQIFKERCCLVATIQAPRRVVNPFAASFLMPYRQSLASLMTWGACQHNTGPVRDSRMRYSRKAQNRIDKFLKSGVLLGCHSAKPFYACQHHAQKKFLLLFLCVRAYYTLLIFFLSSPLHGVGLSRRCRAIRPSVSTFSRHCRDDIATRDGQRDNAKFIEKKAIPCKTE